ncbi:MAG: hypothetical protein KJO67_11395 [Silicimonas sp.]|nr:hypothetical protein [Silicimonas sp.]NNL35985.1 hypothetical protein [Silicimonas sp.]
MRAPWHIWLVGIVSLLWNGMGATDYAMTQFEYGPYLAQFTDEQRAYFQSFPTWVQATWALAVWLSVAGSILLLARSRHAAMLFGVSLICMIATFVHNFGLAEVRMDQIAGTMALWFSILILVVGFGLWIYARQMNKRNVLE